MSDAMFDLGFTAQDVSTATSDDYYTPKWIFDALKIEFDLDVSAPVGGIPWIPAKRHYSIIDDGLTSDWSGMVWMNPPFSDVTPWARKFVDHGNGIALVQMTKGRWFNRLWEDADAILVLASDLKFVTPKGEAKGIFMPCILAAMGSDAVDKLQQSELGFVR